MNRPGPAALRRLVVVLLLAAVLPAAPAGGAPAIPDEAPIVEELVVTAALPSPAWWQVSDGDATVWILGAPMGPLPRDLRWNDAPLRKRLQGAKALILPSGASIGLGDIFPLLRLRGQLKDKDALEPSLPPELAARFAAARGALGKPASRYEGWTPVVAGRQLQQDYYAAWRLRGGTSVVDVAREAARGEKVEVERVVRRGLPVLKSAVQGMRDEDKALVCLAGYLDAVEVRPERYREAATAWARGEVGRAIDLPRGADVCRELFTEAFTTNSVSDQVDAIAAALQEPGAAVAIVPLRQLLLRNGVLQQLKARGFEIVDPAALTD